MPDRAILDKNTRILKVLTTDQNRKPTTDEVIEQLPQNLPVSRPQYAVLETDLTTLRQATQQEINSYQDTINPSRVGFRELKPALIALDSDPTVPQTVKDVFRALAKVYKNGIE